METLPHFRVISYVWEEKIYPGLFLHMLVGGESLSTYMWGGQNTHLPYMWREFTHAGSFLFCMGGENFLYSHTEKNMGTCVLHVNITCCLGNRSCICHTSTNVKFCLIIQNEKPWSRLAHYRAGVASFSHKNNSQDQLPPDQLVIRSTLIDSHEIDKKFYKVLF